MKGFYAPHARIRTTPFEIFSPSKCEGSIIIFIIGQYIKELSRTLYLDNARFLPLESPSRGREKRSPPEPQDRRQRVEDGKRVEQETIPGKRKRLEKELGKKGGESVAAIPGYFEMVYIHVVDLMHTLQVCLHQRHSSWCHFAGKRMFYSLMLVSK